MKRFTLFALLSLTACAALPPEAQAIRYVDSVTDIAPSCDQVGMVGTISKFDSPGKTDAIIKRQAVKLGADTLLIVRDPNATWVQKGVAYRCAHGH